MSQSQSDQDMQAGQFERDKHLVLLDTDIGDDIDDALALALALRSPEIELTGITTVFGDTRLRARLAVQVGTAPPGVKGSRDFYGRMVPFRTILHGMIPMPKEAEEWNEALVKYAGK